MTNNAFKASIDNISALLNSKGSKLLPTLSCEVGQLRLPLLQYLNLNVTSG